MDGEHPVKRFLYQAYVASQDQPADLETEMELNRTFPVCLHKPFDGLILRLDLSSRTRPTNTKIKFQLDLSRKMNDVTSGMMGGY